MKTRSLLFMMALLVSVSTIARADEPGAPAGEGLWQLAKERAEIHRFSTLFTAQDVRQSLATEAGLDEAVSWCRQTGVTKVYVEVFRDGYRAERETLTRARDRFRREGFVVHGCVTPTGIGKRSTGWEVVSCYTNEQTQEQTEQIFRYAAELFDIVMIDDFWFTDCACEECESARGGRSWSRYRLELMERVSRERVIGAARRVNPGVRLIVKYPEWFDSFHERGYDVARQTAMFDVTWIGTETRDPDNARWGRKPQYGAYWLSRWAEAFSAGKLGGGWFDPLGTTPGTYVEQARQTILGGNRESMLFCYGALHRDHGPEDREALIAEIPRLLELAAFIRGQPVRGVGTYKPPNSPPGDDSYIFNFIGMLGIPMTADVRFPDNAPSLLLTEHAAADPALESNLRHAAGAGKAILMTSGLRDRLSEDVRGLVSAPNVRVLELGGDVSRTSYGVLDSVRALMDEPRRVLDELRRPLLAPLGIELSAPAGVAIYLYGPRAVVIENFNDRAAEIELAVEGVQTYESVLALPPGTAIDAQANGGRASLRLPPRALVALRLR